jgi:hypothetical protein
MRKVYLALLIALLPSIAPRIRHVIPALKLDDFAVYNTALVLAREHQGAAIYGEAGKGQDPQLRCADPRTRFAAVARQLGAPRTQLSVYPPYSPTSSFPCRFCLKTAGIIWTISNYVELVAVWAILYLPVRSSVDDIS